MRSSCTNGVATEAAASPCPQQFVQQTVFYLVNVSCPTRSGQVLGMYMVSVCTSDRAIRYMKNDSILCVIGIGVHFVDIV